MKSTLQFLPILVLVIWTTLLISVAQCRTLHDNHIDAGYLEDENINIDGYKNPNAVEHIQVDRPNIGLPPKHVQYLTILLKQLCLKPTVLNEDEEMNTNPGGEEEYTGGGEEEEDGRLPAIVYHMKTFLVFCEGRKGTADSSVSEIVMKRGLLNNTQIIWDQTPTVVARINETRLANPVPFVDKQTNTIFVLYNVLTPHVKEDTFLAQDRYNQSLLLIKSQDLGVTWSKPKNITDETLGRMSPVPVFYAPGPGHGLQMKSGRLVVQGNVYFREVNSTHKTFKSNTTDHGVVFLSDDNGNSWRPGGHVPYAEDNKGRAIDTSESSVVELANSTLMLNSRTLAKEQPRAQSLSPDGGSTFADPVLVKELIEPENLGVTSGCEGSTLGFPAPQDWTKHSQIKHTTDDQDQPWVLFSNPANSILRVFMSVRLSTDGCQTWSNPWHIHELASGYSDLVQYDNLNDQEEPKFGIVYENGVVDTTTRVTYMPFTLDDVKHGIKMTQMGEKQKLMKLKQNRIDQS